VRQRAQVDRLATESRTPLSDRTASAPRHLAAGDGDVSAGVPRRRAGRIAPADGWADEVDFGVEIPVLRRRILAGVMVGRPGQDSPAGGTEPAEEVSAATTTDPKRRCDYQAP